MATTGQTAITAAAVIVCTWIFAWLVAAATVTWIVFHFVSKLW